MTTDEFIHNLKGDWQSQDDGAERVLHRLRRNRWTPHVMLGLEVLGAVGALLIGLWFAWAAAHREDQQLLLGLSAAVLLLSAPVLCIATVRARRAALSWGKETPESLLQIGIRRAEASLRVIRIGRWHLVILALFLAILWAAEVSGMIQAMEFLTFYTATCVIVSLLAWLWMASREKRLRGECDALIRLLAMMRTGDEHDSTSP
jgi:hypothetical protein